MHPASRASLRPTRAPGWDDVTAKRQKHSAANQHHERMSRHEEQGMGQRGAVQRRGPSTKVQGEEDARSDQQRSVSSSLFGRGPRCALTPPVQQGERQQNTVVACSRHDARSSGGTASKACSSAPPLETPSKAAPRTNHVSTLGRARSTSVARPQAALASASSSPPITPAALNSQ